MSALRVSERMKKIELPLIRLFLERSPDGIDARGDVVEVFVVRAEKSAVRPCTARPSTSSG